MRPLLDVRDLTIQFPQSRAGRALVPAQQATAAAPVAAVRSLSFSIAPGEVLGLVGESGSGKSVTSLAIMGLLPPAAIVTGEITFLVPEWRRRPHALSPPCPPINCANFAARAWP